MGARGLVVMKQLSTIANYITFVDILVERYRSAVSMQNIYNMYATLNVIAS